MILVTAQIVEYRGKSLYTDLTEMEEALVRNVVAQSLESLGAEVTVVDIEGDWF